MGDPVWEERQSIETWRTLRLPHGFSVCIWGRDGRFEPSVIFASEGRSFPVFRTAEEAQAHVLPELRRRLLEVIAAIDRVGSDGP